MAIMLKAIDFEAIYGAYHLTPIFSNTNDFIEDGGIICGYMVDEEFDMAETDPEDYLDYSRPAFYVSEIDSDTHVGFETIPGTRFHEWAEGIYRHHQGIGWPMTLKAVLDEESNRITAFFVTIDENYKDVSYVPLKW